jgi:hypothetical protein
MARNNFLNMFSFIYVEGLLISLILNEQAQHQANDNKYYFQKIKSEKSNSKMMKLKLMKEQETNKVHDKIK